MVSPGLRLFLHILGCLLFLWVLYKDGLFLQQQYRENRHERYIYRFESISDGDWYNIWDQRRLSQRRGNSE